MRLDVWLDPVPYPVGQLQSFDNGAVSFQYAEAYLHRAAMPISLSMPLQAEAFGDVITRAFFDNLLPENDQVRRLIEREGISRDDVVGILFHLGADCSGAISCLPEGSEPVKVPGDLSTDYEPLSEEAKDAIMTSLVNHQRLPDDTRDPSPLAGMQGKMALTVLPDGRWALPRPGRKVPSTHILKVPAREDQSDVKHEWAASGFTWGLGLPLIVPQRVFVGQTEGLLIPRFDRLVAENSVRRLHQEDFAQALGLPRGLKYERNGREGREFNAEAIAGLCDRLDNPADARIKVLKATVLNMALGNTDNHAKNHAVLYIGRGAPALAPFYDILPIRLNERFTREFAYHIGNASTFEDLTAEDFQAFFANFGLVGARYRRFIDSEIGPMLQALERLSDDLLAEGMKGFDDLIGDNLKHLNEILNLDLDLRERDLYVASGGRWLAGS